MWAVLLLLVTAAASAAAAADDSFSGTWETTYGRMKLTEHKGEAAGFYIANGARNVLAGSVSDRRFDFHYTEPVTRGEGWFQLSDEGDAFSGKWRPKGAEDWREWTGKRIAKPNFDGLWETRYGKLRLIQTGDSVRGCYRSGVVADASLSGKVAKQKLTFDYKDIAKGKGWFELAQDGMSFKGKWHKEGSDEWHDWNGKRILPRPGGLMLVVIEARWEQGLADDEFSFGEMLDTYFKRVPHVEVRERFFSNTAAFRRWCREIPYVAEPVIISVSSHGDHHSIHVDKDRIGAEAIASALEYASNVELLHFSACSIMAGNAAENIQAALAKKDIRFPISGYATLVPWGLSAASDISYFGMLLEHRILPEEAARQLRLRMPHTGKEHVAGSAFPPMDFRIRPAIAPKRAKP